MPELIVLPDWTLLAPFLVAALALNLTPGADMTYVLARSVTQGSGAGMLSALGIATGSLVHTTAAAIGLSAIVLHSQTAFLVIKYAGAAYLLYLAWRALRDTGRAAGAVNGRPPAPLFSAKKWARADCASSADGLLRRLILVTGSGGAAPGACVPSSNCTIA